MHIYGYVYMHIETDISFLHLCKQTKALLAPNSILISEKQIHSTMPHMQGQIYLLNKIDISYSAIGCTSNCSLAHGFMKISHFPTAC